MRFFLAFIGVTVLYISSHSQSANDQCSSATFLCPNLSYSGSNSGASTDICPGCSDGAAATGNFCFELNNTVWFSFTTNNAGGAATVNISNISCLTGAGNSSELQGIIIDAGIACDESTYSAVSNCEAGQAGSMALNAAGLAPNTTYYVLIDGAIAGFTNAAECDFDIQVSGTAVDPSANIVTVDETCGNTNGSITVNNVSGGSTPYQYSIDGTSFQAGNAFNGLASGNYTVTIQDDNGCIFNPGTAQVGLIGGPTGGAPAVINADCNMSNGEITINGVAGGNPPYQYSLNGGANQASNNFNGLAAGTYTVTVTDQQGCEQIISNIVVPNNAGPTGATMLVSDASCGGSDGSITVNVNGGSAPFSYAINGGGPQASNVFSNLASGNYSILITDNNGCTFEIQTVTVNSTQTNVVPSVSITANPNPACDGEMITYTATATNGGNNPNFNFMVNGTSVQNGSSNVYTGVHSAGDIISCEITSDDPCVGVNTATSNTVTIVPTESPTVVINTSSTDVCANEQTIISAVANGCTGDYNYNWMVNGSSIGAPNDDTLTIGTLQDGDIVTCEISCTSTCSTPSNSNALNFNVTTVNADAGPDFQIIQGSSAGLGGSGSGTPSWSPPETLSDPNSFTPQASPTATTTYTLTVDQNGCTATDEAIVTVTLPIVLTNTFTPNGDGYNDTWQIARIEAYPSADVSIYDRWGQRIYHSIGYSNQKPWDGTRSGSFLPAATYYYIIDLRTGNDDYDLYKGTVTIIY